MSRYGRVGLLLACLGTIGLSTASAGASPTVADVANAPGADSRQQFRDNLLRRINEFRATEGLPPFVADPRLDCIAQWHTEDMEARDYFEHVTPDGDDIGDRYRRATGQQHQWLAENLAIGYRDSVGVVRGWQRSPGHRKNLLHRNVQYAGIGAIQHPDYPRYSRGWLVTLVLSSEVPTLTPQAAATCGCNEETERPID